LLQLVNEKHVTAWNDPRMPTLSGYRRRGYTPESIRNFCERVGIAKRDNLIEVSLLEFCIREHLNKIALRRMVVFDPVKVVLTNYAEGQTEMLPSEDNPEDETAGKREIPFSRELFIEREDFMENPPKKYFRLAPGQVVRLKSAYIIRCEEVVKDATGMVTTLHCTYIPESKSGSDTSGIKAQGTLHWVNAADAVEVEVREYDRLFKVENPAAEEGDFKEYINPDSLKIVKGYAEPALKHAQPEHRFQFIRKGYYCLDTDSGANGLLIFNRTVTLKDAWAKEVKKG
jgi:glutaminyl-tRNA synthetase